MPVLKINIKGDKRVSIDADFEGHIVDGTLDEVFSGVLDGFNITEWRLNSFEPAVKFIKNSIDLLAGESFTINDVNNGLVWVEYYHTVASSAFCNFTLSGDAIYNIDITIYSAV